MALCYARLRCGCFVGLQGARGSQVQIDGRYFGRSAALNLYQEVQGPTATEPERPLHQWVDIRPIEVALYQEAAEAQDCRLLQKLLVGAEQRIRALWGAGGADPGVPTYAVPWCCVFEDGLIAWANDVDHRKRTR